MFQSPTVCFPFTWSRQNTDYLYFLWLNYMFVILPLIFIQFNKLIYLFVFKGTVQQDFWPPVFFYYSNQPGPLINGFKYFLFWLRFCRVAVVSKKLTRPGLIPQGVMFWRISYWLAGIWYIGEIDSQGYDTPGRLTRWGRIPRGVRFLDLKFQ